MSDAEAWREAYEAWHDPSDDTRESASHVLWGEQGFRAGYLAATAHLSAEREGLREALRRFIYETTHLSHPQEDGSHWCKISAAALRRARKLVGGQ